jgi:hypothetical protein
MKAIALSTCLTLTLALTPSSSAQNDNQQATTVEMSNVLFRYSPTLTVYVDRLRGSLQLTKGHQIASFNEPNSFLLATDAAQMRMTTTQLSSLMNDWLLRSPKAQLKNVRIEAQGTQLLIHGTMKKGLHIPFQAIAEPSVTSDNRIRFTVKKVETAHLQVKGLMDALGLTMDSLISQKGLQGMSVDGDSFLIDPQTAFPPPQIRAKVTGVRVSGQSVVITLGQGAPKLQPRPWKNYMALRGGILQYGRDTMTDADLVMIDTTPADPFDFYLGKYWCQIVAGTVKAQPDKGWRVFVPDFGKLPKGACAK